MTVDKRGITRRRFFERSVGLLASAEILACVSQAKDTLEIKADVARTAPASTTGKIALEEHFAMPDAADSAYKDQPTPDFRLQMLDIGERRIAEMDRGGVEICIISHTAPGIQGIPTFQRLSPPRKSGTTISHKKLRNTRNG